MGTEIDLTRPDGALEFLDAAVARYHDATLAPATRRAYSSTIRTFGSWCDDVGLDSYPASPDTVARYIAYRAQHGVKISTIRRDLAALSYLHTYGPTTTDDPTRHAHVVRTVRGIARSHGTAPSKKRPLTPRDIVTMADTCDVTRPGGARDRALIMFGYASSLRRGELAALNRDHLADDPAGLRVTVATSKGDQTHEGQQVGVTFGPTPRLCPVAALRTWLDVAPPAPQGPVFRAVDRHGNIGGRLSGNAIAEILKRRALTAGLDPASVAGHSLRAGHATAAAAAGTDLLHIQQTLRHRKVDTTAGYVRSGRTVLDSSSARLWDDLT